MPRTCTICTHESRRFLEEALIAGRSLRDIARQWRVSKDALARHKAKHLPKHLTEAKEAEVVARADDLLDQVQRLRDRALGILDQAETAGDLRTAVSAVREARGCVELLGKLAGELQEGQTVNVLVMPEWAEIRLSLTSALAPYPEAKKAVASALKELPGARH